MRLSPHSLVSTCQADSVFLPASPYSFSVHQLSPTQFEQAASALASSTPPADPQAAHLYRALTELKRNRLIRSEEMAKGATAANKRVAEGGVGDLGLSLGLTRNAAVAGSVTKKLERRTYDPFTLCATLA